MSYSAHGFTVGQRLTAQAMNEMDAQVALNCTAQEAHQAFLKLTDGAPAASGGITAWLAQQLIAGLRLSVDSDTLYLYYGNQLIGSVSLPLDLDNFVPATGVDIDDVTGDVYLYIGGAYNFSATAAPSNTTQNIRWSVSDLAKANVTSQGRVTALDVGTVVVTAACGLYSDTVTVHVRRLVDCSNHIALCGGGGVADPTYWQNALRFITSSEIYACNIPFSLTEFKIPNGCAVTLSLKAAAANVDVKFIWIGVFKALSGSSIELQDQRENNNHYLIRNVTVLDTAENIHAKTQNTDSESPNYNQWGFWGQNSYTYTNNSGEDAYIAFIAQDSISQVWRNAQDPTAAAEAWFAENVEIVISAASPSVSGSSAP